MRIPQHVVDQARELAKSDQLMEYFVKFYDFVSTNAAYETYIVRRNYQDTWNAELMRKQVELINLSKGGGEVHDAAVNRAMKYFEGQLNFLKDTESIRAMLSPQEQARLNADPRMKKDIDDLAL